MELKIMLKNIGRLSVSKFFQLITQIIRIKLNAIIIGVEGVGIYNQLTILTSKTAQFSQLSINEALVKQIAEKTGTSKLSTQIFSSIKAYVLIVPVIYILVIALMVIFSNQIKIFFLGRDPKMSFYFLAVAALPMILLNSLFFAILRGFKDIKHITRARILGVISNIIIFIPLILGFKLSGVVWSIPVMYTITTFWNFFFLNKYILKPHNINLRKVLSAALSKDSLNEMFVFSGVGITTGFIGILSEFIIRGIIVKELGVEKIGLYSPNIAWAGIFTGVILSSFSTYLYPRLCEAKDRDETIGVMNDSFRISTLILIPFILFLISFRRELVYVFYSKDFLESVKYLPFHFFGIIWHVWFVVFGQAMSPRGFVKQHGLFRGIFFVFDVILVLYFVTVLKLGLFGWMLKFIITPVLLFFIYYSFQSKRIGFYFFKENLQLMVYLVSSVMVLILIDEYTNMIFLNFIVGPGLIMGSYMLLKKSEKEFIKQKIHILKFRK